MNSKIVSKQKRRKESRLSANIMWGGGKWTPRDELLSDENKPFRFTSCRSNEGSQTTRGTKYSLERGYDRRQERDNHYHSNDSVGRQTRSFRAETEGWSFRHEAQRPLRRRQLNSEREWGANSRRKDHRSLSQRLHSYYQGIAKPREDIRREDSNSSKHQHGSTRGVPLEEKAHDHISKEAVETSMGELQDVMNLYLSCADPIESATRKDRVR